MKKKATELDEILNEFFTDFRERGDEALTDYVERYPEHIEELYERAGIARMFERLPEIEMTAEAKDSRMLRSASIVHNLLFKRKNERTDSVAELIGLTPKIEDAGGTLESAAAELRLSTYFLSQLERKKVRPLSVPRVLYERLSGMLEISSEKLLAYMELPEMESPGFYRSLETPTFQVQSDFFRLIELDPDMDPSDKEYWLSLTAMEDEDLS